MKASQLYTTSTQSLSDTTLLGSDIAGTGKVEIIKTGTAHFCKGIYSATTGNITIKGVNDAETEYRTFPVVVGLNDFGILFNKIDKATTTITLSSTVFLL